MITQDDLRQLEANLLGLRERGRDLAAQLAEVETMIKRQEGAVQLAQQLLQRQAEQSNGVEHGSDGIPQPTDRP